MSPSPVVPGALFNAPALPRPENAVVACADNLDFMAGLGDESVQLVVTSPPYTLGKEYEQNSGSSWADGLAESLSRQTRVAAEAMRVLAPSGSLCWQTGSTVRDGEIVPIDSLLYAGFKALGLKLRNRIIWHFGHGLHCSRRLSGRYEVVCWWTKGDDYKWNLDPIRVPSRNPRKRHFKGPNIGRLSGNPLGKNPADVWDIPNVKHNHPEKTAHPCQFPLELAERLVLALTDPGDAVLDPYAGSGTTLAAAVLHGRHGYGCDTDSGYVEIARERVALANCGALPRREPGAPRSEQSPQGRIPFPSQSLSGFPPHQQACRG